MTHEQFLNELLRQGYKITDPEDKPVDDWFDVGNVVKQILGKEKDIPY